MHWIRSPKNQTAAAICLWWLAATNVYWAVGDLNERYDQSARTQAARMVCEARGGYYGALGGPIENCWRRGRRLP
jgi:hypothetical protein